MIRYTNSHSLTSDDKVVDPFDGGAVHLADADVLAGALLESEVGKSQREIVLVDA